MGVQPNQQARFQALTLLTTSRSNTYNRPLYTTS